MVYIDNNNLINKREANYLLPNNDTKVYQKMCDIPLNNLLI